MFYSLRFFSEIFPLFNLFRYITFRALGALFTAFMVVYFLGPWFIATMRRWQKGGQPIRDDVPHASALSKQGTPTMGGMLMALGVLGSCFFWADWLNYHVMCCLLCLCSYLVLGSWDDYIKISNRKNAGLLPLQKFLLQILIALVFVGWMMALSPADERTSFLVPFLKNYTLHLGLFYIIWGVFVVVGTSNAVNLTDGLDGLATGPLVMAFAVLGTFSYVCGHKNFAHYLQFPFIPGVGELAVLSGALIGSGLGFLWYNVPPASIFMGDAGSLSLGATLGLMALAIKQELLLLIIGGVFVVETISVILQVGYFKKSKKRLFLMAPIHHHFEKQGLKESTIVLRFFIVSFLLCILALSSLKIR